MDNEASIEGGQTPPPERPAYPWHHLLALFLAVAGGVLGILGAVVQEVQSGGFVLLPLVGAPIIEEALKPTGIYILLARWPQALRNQLYTAILTAISGLCFGVIEALVYVYIYTDDPPDWFVTYRFTLPLALHTATSFIVGLGITRGVLDWASTGSPFPKRSRNLYITAVLIHAAFNAIGIALSLAGLFDEVD